MRRALPPGYADSVSPRWRYWIELGGQRFELTPGTNLLGRSETCQVLLDDVLVSRQHARIVVDEEARIEDAGSANGVFVNGARVLKKVLADGDAIGIGNQRLHFRREAARSPRRTHRMAETLHGAEVPSSAEVAVDTQQREPLELLQPVIDKALALGRVEEAERLLAPHLQRYVTLARQKPQSSVHTERAAVYAVRLAEATRAARWIDVCFELYTLLEAPLPAAAVEQLYTTLRNVPGVSHETFRAYMEALAREAARFGPRERFLVQRINGLAKLVR